MVKYTELESYENFGKALKISNGTIEAVVTTDVGPRIISFGFCGGQNMFRVDTERAGKWSGPEYDAYFGEGTVSYLYGGHRLWITPERRPETNYPDNEPVDVSFDGDSVVFTAKEQRRNDIQLSFVVTMAAQGAQMKVSSRVKNVRDTAQEFAVWTIAAMHQNGLAVMKQADNDRDLQHNRVLSLWTYTNPSDYRLYLGKRFMSVKQDPGADRPFKIGTNNRCGKAAYALGDDVFVKEYATDHDNCTYPDGGVSFEAYTDRYLLEMESLGEVKTVAPGETAEMNETWTMLKNPGTPDPRSDDELAAFWAALEK